MVLCRDELLNVNGGRINRREFGKCIGLLEIM